MVSSIITSAAATRPIAGAVLYLKRSLPSSNRSRDAASHAFASTSRQHASRFGAKEDTHSKGKQRANGSPKLDQKSSSLNRLSRHQYLDKPSGHRKGKGLGPIDRRHSAFHEAATAKHLADGQTFPGAIEKIQAEIRTTSRSLMSDTSPNNIRNKMLREPKTVWSSLSRIKRLYNEQIDLCLATDRVQLALSTFEHMKKQGVTPSASTYNVLITGIMRVHCRQQVTDRIHRNSTIFKQISEFGEKLEELWKDAFPHYFGSTESTWQTEHDMLQHLKEYEDGSTKQLCDIASQQASIEEVRAYPDILTSALGSYVRFLGRSRQAERGWQLFDQLFGISDSELASALATDKSFSLSAKRPLGDQKTLENFVLFAHDADLRNATSRHHSYPGFKRILDTWIRFIRLETHQSQTAHTQRNASIRSSDTQSDDVKFGSEASKTRPSRFLLQRQDTTMRLLLWRLSMLPKSHWKPTALMVLKTFYGIDLAPCCDGILRIPGSSPGVTDSKGDSIQDAVLTDAHSQVFELRDNRIVHYLLKLFEGTDSEHERIALFNLLWQRSFDEGTIGPLHPFGESISATSVMSLLYTLGQRADPAASRLLLDHMNDLTDRAQREVLASSPGSLAAKAEAQSSLAEWVPRDAAYFRVLYAISAAPQRGSRGRSSSSPSVKHEKSLTADAWKQAKEVLQTWHDNNLIRSQAVDRFVDQTRWESRILGSSPAPQRDPIQHVPVSVHVDLIVSTFLKIARQYGSVRREWFRSDIARDALDLLDATVGLAALVEMYEEALVRSRGRLPQAPNRVRKSQAQPQEVKDFRSDGLVEISAAISTALDTTGQISASRPQVALWKSIQAKISKMTWEPQVAAERPASVLSSAPFSMKARRIPRVKSLTHRISDKTHYFRHRDGKEKIDEAQSL